MKQPYAILGIIIFLGGIAIGVAITWRCNKTSYTIGSETLSVTVTQHDTVHAYKTVHDVHTSMLIDTVRVPACTLSVHSIDTIPVTECLGAAQMYRSDREHSTSSEHFDTSHCYTIDEHEKDGAHIAATLCSRYFTALPPPDLRGKITYVAAPDTQRTILRVDTLTKTKTNWTIAAVAACAGVIAGILLHR